MDRPDATSSSDHRLVSSVTLSTAAAGVHTERTNSDSDENNNDEDDGEPLKAPLSEFSNAELFECVNKNAASIPSAAKQWISRFVADRCGGFAELMSLLLQGGGVTCPITFTTLNSAQLILFIQSLTDLSSEVSPLRKRPLFMKARRGQYFSDEPFRVKKGQKSFRLNYGNMWQAIVQETIASALLWDDAFVELLSTAVVELSKSPIRSLRYVACFAAWKISLGWIAALDASWDGLVTVLRQIEIEQRKRQNKITIKKIESFQKTQEMYKHRSHRLQSMLERLFNGIFAQRYRDVCERVRAITTEAIGQWCLQLPRLYLFDEYLKYIAWSLSDKAGEVRWTAMVGLTKLFEKISDSIVLSEFLVRFRGRLCEMVYDVDDNVAVPCTKLLALLVQKGEIPVHDIQHVYEILTDDAATMRHAVADLVCALLKSNAKERMSSDGDVGEHAAVFDGLINILCTLAKKQNGEKSSEAAETECWTEGGGPSVVTFSLSSDFVRSFITPLFDKLEVLKNWPLLSESLRQEMDKGVDSRLNLILQVLDTCIQLLTDDKLRATRGRHRRVEADDKIRQEMTRHTMDSMAQWIDEFQMDPTKAACLIRMIRGMKLDLFVLRSATPSFIGILENTVEVLFKHHDTTILEECICTLIDLASRAPEELRSLGRDYIKATGQRIAQDVAEVLPRFSSLMSLDEGRNLLTAFSVTLERTKILLVSDNQDALDRPQLSSQIVELLSLCQSDAELAWISGVSLSQCMFLLLLQEQADHPPSISDAARSALERLLAVQKMLLDAAAPPAARCAAAGLMVDLYLLFGRGTLSPSDLRFEPETWMFSPLWPILSQQIQDTSCSLLDRSHQTTLCQAVGILGKLVLYGDTEMEAIKEIRGQFVGLLLSPVPSVADLVRSVIRRLRKSHPVALTDAFLRALTQYFTATHDPSRAAFASLAQRICQCYTVFNDTTARSQAHQLVSEAIRRVTAEESALDLAFISEGFACFVSKLSGRSCEKIRERLLSYKRQKEIDEDRWKVVEPFIRSLAERARRLRAAAPLSIQSMDPPNATSAALRASTEHTAPPPRQLPSASSHSPAPASPAIQLNSQGNSESRAFDVIGWEFDTATSRSSPLPSDAPAAPSVHQPVKISVARHLDEDDAIGPRKKTKRSGSISHTTDAFDSSLRLE